MVHPSVAHPSMAHPSVAPFLSSRLSHECPRSAFGGPIGWCKASGRTVLRTLCSLHSGRADYLHVHTLPQCRCRSHRTVHASLPFGCARKGRGANSLMPARLHRARECCKRHTGACFLRFRSQSSASQPQCCQRCLPEEDPHRIGNVSRRWLAPAAAAGAVARLTSESTWRADLLPVVTHPRLTPEAMIRRPSGAVVHRHHSSTSAMTPWRPLLVRLAVRRIPQLSLLATMHSSHVTSFRKWER